MEEPNYHYKPPLQRERRSWPLPTGILAVIVGIIVVIAVYVFAFTR